MSSPADTKDFDLSLRKPLLLLRLTTPFNFDFAARSTPYSLVGSQLPPSSSVAPATPFAGASRPTWAVEPSSAGVGSSTGATGESFS